MRRFLTSLGWVSVTLLALASSSWGQANVLRVGLPSLPESLDPATALEGSVSVIARQIFDTLVQYREGASDIEPGLAVQWSVSRDGLTWSFRLRDGVRFHDGTPLTAQLVVASLEREILPSAPNAPSPSSAAPRLLRGTPGVVKEIRAADPRTVQISLILPYAPLPAVLAHPAFSIVLASGVSQQRWLGTGPFSLAEAAPGQITLDVNPRYWGGAPRVGGLVFVDAGYDRGEAMLEARAVDLLLPASPPSRTSGAISAPSWRIGYLALETEKEPFNRVRVRRAVAAALDPAELAQGLSQVAVPLLSFLPLGAWGRRDGPPVLEGSPETAKRLLAEVGLSRGASASLLISESGGRIDQVRVAEAIRTSLAPAGITVPILAETPDTTLQMARAGQHEMVLLEARAEAGDPHFLLYPLSSSEGAVKGPSALNLSFYRNSRLDDLLIRASQISFRPERQRLYLRAQAMLAEELPWIPLYVRLYWAVLRPDVRGFRLHPSGNPRFDRVWLDRPTLPPAEPRS